MFTDLKLIIRLSNTYILEKQYINYVYKTHKRRRTEKKNNTFSGKKNMSDSYPFFCAYFINRNVVNML